MTGGAETLLMLLADARLPTGAHTQSGGLEPAMRGGLGVGEIVDYLRVRLTTVTLTEAATSVVVLRDVDQIGAADHAWRARTPSPALRDNADLLGRGYLRVVGRLWPDHPAARALGEHAARGPVCRSVVIGVAAACAGLAPEQVARLVGYDDVQTVTSAALKLEPMDPLTAVEWVVSLQPDIDAMAETAARTEDPIDIPAGSAPWIEAWAEIHAVTGQRLFRA